MKKALEKSGRYLLAILSIILIANAALAAWRSEPRRLPEAASFPTSPSHLDEGTDTLSWDNGTAIWFFSYPAEAGEDSLFNVRFLSPDSCKLQGAFFMLYLGEDSLYTAPYFAPLVWSMGADSFPSQILGGDTVPWAEVNAFYPNWFFADLSSFEIHLDSAEWFHIGFTGVLEQSTDTIAIVADNGVPSTPYSGFMWRGEWYSMDSLYGVGYNLFIRALVDLGSGGLRVLSPGNMPTAFHLDSPYPNPFNPTTTLRFSVTTAEPVQLTVNDILGRTVATLIQGRMSPGAYSIAVDGTSWPSGIYFANLAQGRNRQVVKLVLMK